MDENKSIWNKTGAELTVGDAMKVNLIAMTVMAAPFAVLIAVSLSAEKIREIKKNRQNKKLKK